LLFGRRARFSRRVRSRYGCLRCSCSRIARRVRRDIRGCLVRVCFSFRIVARYRQRGRICCSFRFDCDGTYRRVVVVRRYRRSLACSIHFHVLAGLHWFRDQHVQTGNGAAQTDEQNHIREINADGDGGRSEGEVRQNIEYNADDRESTGVTVLEDALPVLERTARQDRVRAVHEAVHVQETAERERQEGHQKSDHQIRQTEINGREIEDSPNRADDHADRGQKTEHQRRRVGIPTLARAGQGTKITPRHKKAR